MAAMERGDLSERMERHLSSSETTLVRQERAVARHEGILGRHVEVLNRQEGEGDDIRVEIREQGLRQEKILREMFKQLGAFMETQTRLTEELVAGLAEVRDEVRAQRKAILAILDRLPPPADAG
jgi:hypothetical protein